MLVELVTKVEVHLAGEIVIRRPHAGEHVALVGNDEIACRNCIGLLHPLGRKHQPVPLRAYGNAEQLHDRFERGARRRGIGDHIAAHHSVRPRRGGRRQAEIRHDPVDQRADRYRVQPPVEPVATDPVLAVSPDLFLDGKGRKGPQVPCPDRERVRIHHPTAIDRRRWVSLLATLLPVQVMG